MLTDKERRFYDEFDKLLILDADARHHCGVYYGYSPVGLFNYIEDLKNKSKVDKEYIKG